MKKEQGFSLIELLIVVAIIAIIAAIAVPSMLTARMAANESGAIQGCRTVGSAQVAFAAINNQNYATVADLVDNNFLDTRFDGTFSGYTYAEDAAIIVPDDVEVAVANGGFGVKATPDPGSGRFMYSIAPDQVVRYQGSITDTDALCGPSTDCAAGDAIGTTKAGS